MNAFVPLLIALLSSAPTPDPASILVLKDQTLRALPPGRAATPEDLAQLDHAWVWSERSAPRRIVAERFGKEAAGEDRERIAVKVAGAGGEARRECLVVAAPVAMWEEVPEDLLPGWLVPRSGRVSVPLDPSSPWRLRLLGCGGGSWWVDLPAGRKAATLASHPAGPLTLQVTDTAGRPLSQASLTLLTGSDGRGGARRLAIFRSDARGSFRVPDVPPAAPLTLLVEERNHLPATVVGPPGNLPGRIALDAGAAISGRFVDGGGAPLAGVSVSVESWVSDDLPSLSSRAAASGEDGRWLVRPVPRARVALTASAPGLAPYRQRLEVEGGAVDLGAITLFPAASLPVEVVNDLGVPVAGAVVSAGPGAEAATDARGRAVLRGIHPREPSEISITARGHLAGTSHVPVPLPQRLRVEIERAFRVTARFLDAEGVPVLEGKVRIQKGSSFSDEPLLDGGRLERDLQPGEPVEFVFSSPATRELRVGVESGAAGEARDLGDLKAPPGLVVTGRVVAAGNGGPVASASVWVPRPSPLGPLMAWAHRDLLQAESREDGSFDLAGLPPGPIELRIDAPGFARSRLAVNPAAGQSLVELGDVSIDAGTTLRVVAATPDTAGVARVDLGGKGLELDMLSTPLVDGVAEVRHVPAGPVTVAVHRDRSLLCEEELTVAPGELEREVECRGEALVVRGRVTVGGEPAGAGTLAWLPPANTMAGGIFNFSSPGGLRQQHGFGAGRPQVTVAVDARGHFSSNELRPGRWDVLWMPSSGAFAEPRQIEVPRGAEYEVTLDYPGLVLRGVVVDGDGQPTAAAQVREVDGRTAALSGADGSFTLVVPPGRYRIQARHGELASAVESVECEAGRDPRELRLVLAEQGGDEVEILVLAADERPAAGAFVFVETEGRGLRLVSADGSGKAVVRLEPPYPTRLRAAALTSGTWTFGTWQSLDAARQGTTLVTPPSGSLVVSSTEQQGAPRVVTTDGWDVAGLLMRLGSLPELAPAQPLEIQGLPEGVYSVSLGAVSTTAAIRQGRRSEIALE